MKPTSIANKHYSCSSRRDFVQERLCYSRVSDFLRARAAWGGGFCIVPPWFTEEPKKYLFRQSTYMQDHRMIGRVADDEIDFSPETSIFSVRRCELLQVQLTWCLSFLCTFSSEFISSKNNSVSSIVINIEREWSAPVVFPLQFPMYRIRKYCYSLLPDVLVLESKRRK